MTTVRMKNMIATALVCTLALIIATTAHAADKKPNIVLILMDNLGYGEVGKDLYGVKWRNWKMMFKEIERGFGEVHNFSTPHFFNLYDDPREEHPMHASLAGEFWVRWPVAEVLKAHTKSLQKEPPIKTGTPDSYVPKKLTH